MSPIRKGWKEARRKIERMHQWMCEIHPEVSVLLLCIELILIFRH